MKLNRNYVTPFISLVFLVVGLSGILMFFHLFDGYTEIVHEYLGMLFILCAIFHILLNWKPLKVHFGKSVFIPAILSVFTISVVFIFLQIMNPKIDKIVINKIIKAPISDSFRALGINYEKASKKLKENGISIEGATTIEAIWIKNESTPEKVIDLILH